jgi:sodium/potassium-transporting ATPase subunit alpha
MLIAELATAMAVSAIVACQVANLFASRTETLSFFELPLFSNRFIFYGIGFEVGLLCLIIYFPVFQRAFDILPFEWHNVGVLLACVPTLLVADELQKYFARKQRMR